MQKNVMKDINWPLLYSQTEKEIIHLMSVSDPKNEWTHEAKKYNPVIE